MAKKKVSKKRVAKKVAPKWRRFVFTGDPINGDDPATINWIGKTFALNGDPVSVPDEIAEKLATHSHFTEKT